MKKKFEQPNIEIVEIVDFIVTSPESGGGGNNWQVPTNPNNPGGGW